MASRMCIQTSLPETGYSYRFSSSFPAFLPRLYPKSPVTCLMYPILPLINVRGRVSGHGQQVSGNLHAYS